MKPTLAPSIVTLREATYGAAHAARNLATDATATDDDWNAAARSFRTLHEQLLEARGEPPEDPAADTAKLIAGYVTESSGGGSRPPSSAPTVSGLPRWPGNRAPNPATGAAQSLGAAFLDARRQKFGAQTDLIEPGSTLVSLPIRTQAIADPRQATFIAQMFQEVEAAGGHYAYSRQTVRTLRAAVVERGARKPTSEFQLKRVAGEVKTLAHVTDPISRFDLEDASVLRAFIDAELRLGLDIALDALIIAAILDDAEHINPDPDLIIESGFTDAGGIVVGIRQAITALQVLNFVPSAVGLSPTTWQTIELVSIGAFSEAMIAFKQPVDAVEHRLFGLPVVVTNSLADDVAVVGDFGSESGFIPVTGGIRIDLSEATPREPDDDLEPTVVSDFQLNQVIARAERRANFALARPLGFKVVEPAGS